MVTTLEQAKQYLRVEGTDEDTLITNLITTAEAMCEDILRQKLSELETIPETVILAIQFATAYLYENRETANYDELIKSLKILLSANRIEMF
jgi:uncharacterized phage protein (predicted DNA packaging)